MRIFVDEDTGPGLARALIDAGIKDVDYVAPGRRITKGADDEEWIRYAGQNRLLVLSRNNRILFVQAQRELLIAERVGIVFLPHKATAAELVRLTLDKLEWLRELDATQARPFAFAIYRNSQVAQKDLRQNSAG